MGTGKWTAALAPMLLAAASLPAAGTTPDRISEAAAAVEDRVIAWRRDIHEHPELSNRERRTADLIAGHLRSLGLTVATGVAHTGVVGVLEGGRPGPVVALRADMDALPVTERTGLPFASTATAEYEGEQVGVMHACGHDTHVAMLMAVADVLAGLRDELPGTVKFLFQPAEEGAPRGEQGGASLMVSEGVLEDPSVDAAFAMHIDALGESGTIGYRPGGTYASVDDFRIIVRGKGAHGAYPWMGADPVLAASHVVVALQSIVSRELTLTDSAGVVTVGSIHGGNRSNIIPEQVELIGTIRALDPDARTHIHDAVRRIATHTAESYRASAEVEIPYSDSSPVTYNDPELTAAMVPALTAAAGADRVILKLAETGAEDFACFAELVPSFYFSVGAMPPGQTLETTADHHTPEFVIDEDALRLGVRAMTAVALARLEMGAGG